MVEYSNEGDYIATHWMPTQAEPAGAAVEDAADGYGYDLRVLPRKNVMLTSSFTGWNNYMKDLGSVMADPQPTLEQYGRTLMNSQIQVPKVPSSFSNLRCRAFSSSKRNCQRCSRSIRVPRKRSAWWHHDGSFAVSKVCGKSVVVRVLLPQDMSQLLEERDNAWLIGS